MKVMFFLKIRKTPGLGDGFDPTEEAIYVFLLLLLGLIFTDQRPGPSCVCCLASWNPHNLCNCDAVVTVTQSINFTSVDYFSFYQN